MKKMLQWSYFAGCLLVAACNSQKGKDVKQEKYPVVSPVIIDTVYTSEYVADIHSLQNIEIRARVKGYVENIYVDEGKRVKAGQTLFSISSQHYRQELIKAKAVLKNAIAAAQSAELEVKNTQILLDKNIISKTELELAQSKLNAANAKVEEAESEEASANLNLSLTEVKAPFDGIVNRIPNKVGSLIDEGTLLTTLSNNKEVYAYFHVSEREYLDITAQKASAQKTEANLILANGQPYPIKGTIETVEGEFDKITGNIAFRARFTNPSDLLKHGSSGKILLKKELKRAMIIPQKSTFEIQENTYVFTVDSNNVVHTKIVVPRLRIQNLYVLESGLQPADKFVFEGIQHLKEGDKIIPEVMNSKQAFYNLTK